MPKRHRVSTAPSRSSHKSVLENGPRPWSRTDGEGWGEVLQPGDCLVWCRGACCDSQWHGQANPPAPFLLFPPPILHHSNKPYYLSQPCRPWGATFYTKAGLKGGGKHQILLSVSYRVFKLWVILGMGVRHGLSLGNEPRNQPRQTVSSNK